MDRGDVGELLSPYRVQPAQPQSAARPSRAVVDFDRLRATDEPQAVRRRDERENRTRRDLPPQYSHRRSRHGVRLPARLVPGGGHRRPAYWDGGYAGNPPLWPLFYETQCRDAIIVQINPIEREEIPDAGARSTIAWTKSPSTPACWRSLRAADFVARLIRTGLLKSDEYREERLHRIGGAGKLEFFNAATKNDVSWPFLKRLRDLGRDDAKEWLEENFDTIGVESTLDIDRSSAARPGEGADEGRAGDGLIGGERRPTGS